VAVLSSGNYAGFEWWGILADHPDADLTVDIAWWNHGPGTTVALHRALLNDRQTTLDEITGTLGAYTRYT
jgi:hypothetical protein